MSVLYVSMPRSQMHEFSLCGLVQAVECMAQLIPLTGRWEHAENSLNTHSAYVD